ncbi:MAG: hypothetical protein ACRD1R_12750 [Acidobacteriota bacterium]
MQKQVEEFHRAMGLTVGGSVALRNAEMRAELIREEAQETVEAIEQGDLAAAVDGLCDLIYVALGAAVTWGIDLEPVFNEVHRANMAKLGGPVRADGKQLKPDGWQPPRIAEMIDPKS